MVMLDSSGAPPELVVTLLVPDPELQAVMPRASPAMAMASALRRMREAFIVLPLVSFW